MLPSMRSQSQIQVNDWSEVKGRKKLDAIFLGICIKGLWQGDLPGGLLVNNLPTNARDMCSIPGLQRFHMLQGT